MTDRKRPPVAVLIILLLTAFAGFYRVTQSPSFGTYRTVDVVQLVGSGACFGAVMVAAIVRFLRFR
jgi:hypothetical protein